MVVGVVVTEKGLGNDNGGLVVSTVGVSKPSTEQPLWSGLPLTPTLGRCVQTGPVRDVDSSFREKYGARGVSPMDQD